jgi:hypothetical protein
MEVDRAFGCVDVVWLPHLIFGLFEDVGAALSEIHPSCEHETMTQSMR